MSQLQSTGTRVPTTTVVPDDSQLGFHIDHIKCSECETMQSAKVIHGYPKYKYIHQCVGCGHIITKKDWKSVQ